MRDAKEIDRMYEQRAPWIRDTVPGHPVGPVTCIEPKATTLALVSLPRGQATARAYASRWHPERYFCPLLPGLPLWLFWPWQEAGVPITGVVFGGQSREFPELLPLLRDAWELCDDHITVETADLRNGTCRANGSVITIEHLLHGEDPTK